MRASIKPTGQNHSRQKIFKVMKVDCNRSLQLHNIRTSNPKSSGRSAYFYPSDLSTSDCPKASRRSLPLRDGGATTLLAVVGRRPHGIGPLRRGLILPILLCSRLTQQTAYKRSCHSAPPTP